jgi:hypothetical protein
LQTEGDLVGARATALRGAQAFTDSPGGKLCRNLILTIESKSVSIQTERVWNAPWPEISVQYRNLDKVYFKVIPFDWGALLDTKTRYPETMDQPARKALLSKQTALEWSSPLPATAGLQRENRAALTTPGVETGLLLPHRQPQSDL